MSRDRRQLHYAGAAKFLSLGCLLLSTLLAPNHGRASDPPLVGTLSDLGSLGGSESFAYAVNDWGHVVGMSQTAGNSSSHAFLYQAGQVTDLYPLNSQGIRTVGPTGINNQGTITSGVLSGGIYMPAIRDGVSGQISVLGSLGGMTAYGLSGVATAINDRNQVAGYAYVDEQTRHAFLWQDGSMTDLGSLGGYSFARSLNEAGTVVGIASDAANGVGRACVWDGSGVRALFPDLESSAHDINNTGQIVGQLLTDGDYRAFLYQGETTALLPSLPTGRNGIAYAINEAGHVVGEQQVITSIEMVVDPFTDEIYYQTNYSAHAFLYDGDTIRDLNDFVSTNSGWVLSHARDINEAGEIVGYGELNGEFRAFLLVVPEPNTLTLLGMGGLAGGWLRMRGRRGDPRRH